MTSLLVIDAIVSSLEAPCMPLACLYRAVILCMAMDFSLMAVEIWFIGEGAVMAGWIVACEASITLFGARISQSLSRFRR